MKKIKTIIAIFGVCNFLLGLFLLLVSSNVNTFAVKDYINNPRSGC